MSLANVPEALKNIKPFLQRAIQLQEKEPIISYYSNYYAAKLAIGKASKDNNCRPFIVELLDLLEKQKNEIGDEEAISNELVGYAHVENFALKIFTRADNEDRAGQSSQKTAKNFVAAANFLDLLKVFGDIDSEIEEKITYAKWRAADIVKALRDGRQPTPPPGTNNNNNLKKEELEILDVSGPSSTPTNGFDNNMGGASGAPTNTFSPSSTATSSIFPVNSTLHHPQTPQQAIQGGPAFPTISNFPSPPLGHSSINPNNNNANNPNNTNNGFNDSMGNNNNGWNQSNINPYSNQEGQVPYNNNPVGSPPVQPQQPPLSQFSPADYTNFNNTQPTLPVSPAPPTSQYSPYQPSIPASAPAPAPAPASNPYIPQPQQPLGGGYNSPSAPYQHAQSPYAPAPVVLDPTVSTQVQKHCKWTISALTYDDIPTAIENLEKALALLRPYHNK
ncbi:hypothetical protein FBU30_003954 [Linnemannia zychae]|nr:hypothetical protein FBU30_003954 [Linnemannia zychae]